MVSSLAPARPRSRRDRYPLSRPVNACMSRRLRFRALRRALIAAPFALTL
jgi:hypothetical protein